MNQNTLRHRAMAALGRLSLFLCLIVSAGSVRAYDQDIPDFAHRELNPEPHRVETPKALGGFFETDWQAVIDSTWGPSPLTSEERLTLFNTFWTYIDALFACFQDLDVDWDSLKTHYESEVAGDISRGRFAAIMNHLARNLYESHTSVGDLVVSDTWGDPGVPIMYTGGWGDNRHFGAGLTPLPDKSLLVYKAVENHPLGLEPGDRVLGYEGVLWKDLYPLLLAEEFPIRGWWWGCSPSAWEHSWLMTAGLDWHLFDTIDVMKYGSEEIVSLSTAPLVDTQAETLFCTEQLDIPGVPMPTYPDDPDDVVSWGLVEDPFGVSSGLQIGYIYIWGWFGDVEQEFYDAVYDLMITNDTAGLIIDFRMNYGGNMFLSNPGLELLFNQSVETINFDCRCDPNDHNGMCPCGFPNSAYVIPGDPTTFYDNPIAVLTGPGAVSSGDQVALRMKFHPNARFFGKSTTTAFNSPRDLDLGQADWWARYARADAYLLSDPGHYLTHDEFVVDEEVWLTPDDVALGIDTVVQAAISWILDASASAGEVASASGVRLLPNRPNPFSSGTSLRFTVAEPSHLTLRVYDTSGRLVRTLLDGVSAAGAHTVAWDGTNEQGREVASGVFYLRLSEGTTSTLKRMLRLR